MDEQDVFQLWAIKQGLLLEADSQGAYKSPATVQSFRAFLLGLAQPCVPHWSPISSAPRDGTPVLIKIKSLERMLAEQRSIEFAGMVFVGSNRNTIMQWGFAAPVGYGGIPDDWIEGWMALPGVAVPESAA